MAQLIYLDHAAATPVDRRVLKAMEPFFADRFYNASATYLPAIKARESLNQARAGVARWLGAKPSEIIFTAGGTEANNLAIQGVMRQFPKGNIVVSAIEHESVLEPAGQYDCRVVKAQADGRLDLDDLRAKIDDQTVLVSVMYANNEIGTIQPLREVAKIVTDKRRNRKLPLYFHSDAAQAGNYLDLHVSRLGVDLMTINGGKIYGPKQSGALFVKTGLTLEPLIYGGGQERGLRSGTENLAATVGLATALDLVQTERHDEARRLQHLQDQFFKELVVKIPQAVINGSRRFRLPNNLHFTLPGRDNERLLLELEQAGILAAAGSACSASSELPSHVLRSLGLDDATARASLRLTMGRSTTPVMMRRTLDALQQLV